MAALGVRPRRRSQQWSLRALGIDLDWAVVGNTGFSALLFGCVLLRQPVQPEPEPPEVDEEFVRRLEALAARMRQELEGRRPTAAR